MNNTIVDLEQIMGGSDLFCFTNTTQCCNDGNTAGVWHFPNGALVPDSGSGFSREAGTSFIALAYSSSLTQPPSGLYRCVIPDSAGQSVTLFAGIYGRGEGVCACKGNQIILLALYNRCTYDHLN